MTTAREGRQAALVDFTALYRAHAQDLRRFAWDLSGDAALADVRGVSSPRCPA